MNGRARTVANYLLAAGVLLVVFGLLRWLG